MSPRGLAILVALLALAVFVVWRVDRPAPTKPAGSDTVGGLLPEQLDAVRALEFVRADESVRVERIGNGSWKLVAPFEAEADAREVEEVFRAAADAKIRRVVEEKGTDLAPFGLAPPVVTLRVERADGTAAVALAIGRESPMGGARYATPGDGRVLLVEGLDPGVTARDADSLRERRLIPLAESDIRRITLDRPDGSLELERTGDGWRLTAPIEDAADTPTTDGLARTIATLALAPAAGAVPEPGKAEITVTVATNEERTLRAQLGPAAPDGSRWARREGASTTGTLESGSVADLTREPSEYRDRRVVRAESDEIRALRIVDAGRTIRAWRSGPGSTWTIQDEPGGAPITGSETKVGALLDRLRWLRAERFDGPGPASDARVVELEGSGGLLGRIELDREPYTPQAETGDSGPKLLRVRSSWRPGASLSVAADRVGELPQRAAELAEAPSAADAAASKP